MRLTRGHVIVAAIAAGATIAACSSNNTTGPSAHFLAHLFDSAATVDGATNRGTIERFLALMADEGTQPTSVTLTIDGGTLKMQMMAVELFDTSTTGSGLPTDSSYLQLGYNSDYTKYLGIEQDNHTGNPDLLPPHRIRIARSDLAQIRTALRGGRRDLPIAASMPPSTVEFAEILQGAATSPADTTTITASTAAGSGSCAWQHVALAYFTTSHFDSTTTCKPITLTASFAFHFPSTVGIDASLQHVSLASAATVHGPRVVPRQ